MITQAISQTEPASTGAPVKPEVVATNNVIAVVQNSAEFFEGIKAANPALYNQMVGSLSTYGKSAAAPAIGSLLGLAAAYWGLSPYLSAETLNLLTEVLILIGTSAGAIFMHWWGKRPGRELAATPAETIEKVETATPPQGTTP